MNKLSDAVLMIRKGGPVTGWLGVTLLVVGGLFYLYAAFVGIAVVVGLLVWLFGDHAETLFHNFIWDMQIGFWLCTITSLVGAVGYGVVYCAKRIARFLIKRKWLMRCGVLGEALNAALTVLAKRD